jgi:hypothetical protein
MSSDISNIRKFCESKNDIYLALLSQTASNIFINRCTKFRDKLDEDRGKLADQVLRFFRVFTVHYMTDIYHHTNTCFLAASVWFLGSMELLLTLSYYNDNVSPSSKNLIDRLYPRYTFKKRPEMMNVNKRCVYYDSYQRGDQDDMTMNIIGFLEGIPQSILDRVICTHSEIRENNFIDIETQSPVVNPEQKYQRKYETLKSKILRDNIKNEQYTSLILKLFPQSIDLNMIKAGESLSKIAKLRGFKGYKDVVTINRFCGDAYGYNDVCDLFSLYTTGHMIGNFDTRRISDKKLLYTLSVSEHKSVQSFLIDYIKPSIDYQMVTKKIVKTTETTITSNENASYLIIQFSFQGIISSGKGGVRNIKGGILSVKNLDINDSINFLGSKWILTSVGVKSGSVGGGHWWCLVRESPLDNNFLRYDDMAPIRRYKNIKKTGGVPAILCYTKVPLYK